MPTTWAATHTFLGKITDRHGTQITGKCKEHTLRVSSELGWRGERVTLRGSDDLSCD